MSIRKHTDIGTLVSFTRISWTLWYGFPRNFDKQTHPSFHTEATHTISSADLHWHFLMGALTNVIQKGDWPCRFRISLWRGPVTPCKAWPMLHDTHSETCNTTVHTTQYHTTWSSWHLSYLALRPPFRSILKLLDNRLATGLGFRKQNCEILLTLTVAKHLLWKRILVSLYSWHKGNNETKILCTEVTCQVIILQTINSWTITVKYQWQRQYNCVRVEGGHKPARRSCEKRKSCPGSASRTR